MSMYYNIIYGIIEPLGTRLVDRTSEAVYVFDWIFVPPFGSPLHRLQELMLVCFVIVNLAPHSVFGMQLAEGSGLPDMIFMVCGVLIGGMGGILQAASRSLMVRHTVEESATEYFGLYGLSGREQVCL